MQSEQPSPDFLAPLFAPLTSLPGIGPRHASLLEKIAGGRRVLDLLFTLPERIVDRRILRTVAAGHNLAPGEILTTRVRVLSIRKAARPGQPSIIRTEDDTAKLDLVFFQQKNMPAPTVGAELLVSGKTSRFQGELTMPQPDHVTTWEKRDSFPRLEPVWPLTAGLFPYTVRKAMRAALTLLPDFPEWQDHALVQKRRWPAFTQALHILQAPESIPAHVEWAPVRERALSRLAADELLADQLCFGLARLKARSRIGRSMPGTGALQAELNRRFGHKPTAAQSSAIIEIRQDMTATAPMMRLLQGDVGAGKTFVAMNAMLQAVESGAQAALMAPTEILARQHFETVSRLCPTQCVYLSGTIKGAARRETLAAIADGTARIIVGTHALFQEGVTFADLGLAVIDEQHRFGVKQRMNLSAKGQATDILVMTATPIPRTLQLMEWGEMSVSRLDSKPAGRQPIRTTLHNMDAMPDILAAISRAVADGVQVFWVCPLIENSETQSAAAAEERWAMLGERFPSIVGLAHGKQDIAIRQAALEAFRKGETRILVATTVIEVGVDIPNASVMVIEQAERFGLAQLHQLRGRVGRGSKKSFCLLLHDGMATPTAVRRLTLLRDTNDGFMIADEDYRIRGGGDLAGDRQSGLPGFRLAQGARISLLLAAMQQDSERELMRNPSLEGPRGAGLRIMLTLFDRSEPDRLLISG
ncbi:ATP-dependent DNA helicase RecG [Gluconobacter cerinus]|uniref:ATP-dependent DNA helicase RecG n=1 Tax=Gluconobacter cerinus TaxID=38307 RepID=UPI001B8C95EC|nr:ATP-dependent DNA helicase RecG [Gluconobacter cerinus]MBS1041231.1 ATP-dependent DNA helicase RecG [Gluconobacter cerinus]MBS1047708.1 ATP-dependent DNA helicase RecG [Gluconobacter cerinus]